MRTIKIFIFTTLLFTASITIAQTKDPVVESIVKEATENSQLEKLAHELVDMIGPRLVGTPQMKQSHDWAIAKVINYT